MQSRGTYAPSFPRKGSSARILPIIEQADLAFSGEPVKQGYLSQYFDGVAVKQLSAVEADVARSHQHEYNGVVET